MNKELIISGIFIFTIFSQMSFKFFLGFGLGIYVATEYDLRPIVSYSKQNIIQKYNEIIKTPEDVKVEPKKDITYWFSDKKNQ